MLGTRRWAVALATAAALAACGGGGGKQARVTIKTFQFTPGRIEVTAGDRVTWTNNDDIAHTVTAGAPGAPSGLFDHRLDGAGTNGAFTFTAAGTQAYFCNIHQAMRGEVVVG